MAEKRLFVCFSSSAVVHAKNSTILGDEYERADDEAKLNKMFSKVQIILAFSMALCNLTPPSTLFMRFKLHVGHSSRKTVLHSPEKVFVSMFERT